MSEGSGGNVPVGPVVIQVIAVAAVIGLAAALALQVATRQGGDASFTCSG